MTRHCPKEPVGLLRSLLAPATLLTLLFTPDIARSQCDVFTLADGVPQESPTATRNWFAFPSTANWAVVAVSGDHGDWDLYGYSSNTPGTPPDCFGAASLGSNFGVGQSDLLAWNFAGGGLAAGTKIAEVRNDEGSGGPTVEYDGSPVLLVVDAPPVVHEPVPDDIVELYTVDLVAGDDYTIALTPGGPGSPGEAVAHVFAPSAAPLAAPDASLGPLGAYHASATGRHAIAVVYGGQAASRLPFAIAVTTCAPPVAVPLDGISVPGSGGTFAFLTGLSFPDPDIWSAVALRSGAHHAVGLWRDPSGGGAPECLAGPLTVGESSGGQAAFFASRDTVHYVRGPYADVARLGGPPGGRLRAAYALEALDPETGPQPISVAANDIVGLRRVRVQQGRGYDVTFSPPSPSGWSLVLMAEATQAGHWFARADAALDLPGASVASFVAPADGDALLAVLDETGSGGTAMVGIAGNIVDAGEPHGTRARLLGLQPNPVWGSSVRVSFESSAAGTGEVRVADVAGRERGHWRFSVPGSGSHTFDLGNALSRSLPPGIYFVSLRIDGRPVGTSRLVRLSP